MDDLKRVAEVLPGMVADVEKDPGTMFLTGRATDDEVLRDAVDLLCSLAREASTAGWKRFDDRWHAYQAALALKAVLDRNK